MKHLQLWSSADVGLFQNHKTIKVGKELQGHQVQPVTEPSPCQPEQSTACHIQDFLDQGWWLHHIPWQSRPMFNHLFHEEIPWYLASTWCGYTQPSKAFLLSDISFWVHFSPFFPERFLVVGLVSWKLHVESLWTRSSVQWCAACTTACLWSGSCLNLVICSPFHSFI